MYANIARMGNSQRIQIPQMIFLSEGNREKEENGFPVIFKYQAVSEIMTEIFTLLAENDKISYRTEIVSKRAVEMNCGYAPFGGGGGSDFLFKRAEALAKRAKVLYVNLEEFQGFSYLFQEKQGEKRGKHGGMSEVLLYLRQKKGKLALKLESVLYRKDTLDCILSVEDFRDLYAMTKEDMHDFLSILLEQTDYEIILFDIGLFSEAAGYLMEKCEVIYMPEPKGKIQISKMEAFEKNLKKSGKEKMLEKREWIRIS